MLTRCSIPAPIATSPSSGSPTRRSSRLPSSNSFVGSRANAPSCGTPSGSSHTCSPGSSGSLSVLYPRQVGQSAGFDGAAWVRWGSFSVYGIKLHLLCATNRVPLSYELTAASVAEARLTRELLEEAKLGEGL